MTAKPEMKIYSDDFLLERFYNSSEGQQMKKKGRTIMARPKVVQINKKTSIVNFSEICNQINRKNTDVMAYICDELTVVCSITGNGALLMTGFYKPEKIEEVMRDYVTNYVQCNACLSDQTELIKEDRILYLICKKCKCKRAINKNIKL